MNTPTIADVADLAIQITQATGWEYCYQDYAHQPYVTILVDRSTFVSSIETMFSDEAASWITTQARHIYRDKGNCYSTSAR